MTRLIQEAFLHIEGMEAHVHKGYYDLLGDDGNIILPSVWEHVVEPDWSVTMQMWPVQGPEPEKEAAPAASAAVAEEEEEEEEEEAPATEKAQKPPPHKFLSDQPATVTSEGVFNFLEGAMADRTHSLHIALFKLHFDYKIPEANVTVSCNLGPVADDISADVESWKVGFFHRYSWGVWFEKSQEPRHYDRSVVKSATFGLEDAEGHGVVVLVRRRRSEEAVSFTLGFDVANVDYGYVSHDKIEETVHIDEKRRPPGHLCRGPRQTGGRTA